MSIVRALVAVVLALIVQMALARYAVGGRWVFDLVLVGVVYAALYLGPVAGMWAGSIGGLVQDVLTGDVAGVGALVKTGAGFAVGVVGGQFVVARPLTRAVIVAVVTLLHRLIIIGLMAGVHQQWQGLPWSAVFMEMALNAAAGFVAFQVTDRLPDGVRHLREGRRSSLSRRRW